MVRVGTRSHVEGIQAGLNWRRVDSLPAVREKSWMGWGEA